VAALLFSAAGALQVKVGASGQSKSSKACFSRVNCVKASVANGSINRLGVTDVSQWEMDDRDEEEELYGPRGPYGSFFLHGAERTCFEQNIRETPDRLRPR